MKMNVEAAENADITMEAVVTTEVQAKTCGMCRVCNGGRNGSSEKGLSGGYDVLQRQLTMAQKKPIIKL